MKRLLINKGDKFGRLSIIEEINKKGGKRYFKCKCKCGKEKNIELSHLRNGKTSSCGCYAREMQSKQGFKSVKYMIATLQTHGLSKTRIYRIYRNIKTRCEYEKYFEFKYYGGRGIKCEWKTFEDFRDDMYNSYLEHIKNHGTKNTTIDRIDSNGNYSKENCKWATCKEQCINKRSKNGYKLDGTHGNQKIFDKEINIIKSMISDGYTGVQIAKKLGVYKSCIYFNIKKYGLK